VEDKAVDLPYLREHPQHLPTFLTHQRIRETPVGGGDVCTASRLTLDDGNSLFAKTWPSGAAPEQFFATEAAGLEWLRETGTVPIPEVIVALPEMLALVWIDTGSPSRPAAARLGRDLAEMHRTGAESFGAPWTGFIGPLTQDNTPSAGPWGPWFAESRLLPYLKTSADSGALSASEVKAVEQKIKNIDGYGGNEPPSRIHGDLWPGNVLWSADGRAWLIDPAAHGGHRETDLAQLALFGGAPELPTILAAYQEVWPLADGWQDRIAVHQLHLLLVHTAAFGGAYRGAVRAALGL
jgi:fructosamine-3-kinase